MVQLQGFGALLFGAVALAFVGVVALMFGGPSEITAAAAAMACAYGSQWCSFTAAYLYEVDRQRADPLNISALVLMIVSAVLAFLSLLASVWF